MTVRGSSCSVDYAGTSKQIDRGLNSVMNYTYAYTVYPIKCALDPLTPRNEGSYRSVTVDAPPEGSILNPRYPAPCNARQLTGHLLAGAVYGALRQAIPGQGASPSAAAAPTLRSVYSGVDRAGQPLFAGPVRAAAAWARARVQDGHACTAFPTNSGSGSIEAFESHRAAHRVAQGAAARLRRRRQVPRRPRAGGRGRGGRARAGCACRCSRTVRSIRPQGLFGGGRRRAGRDRVGGRPHAASRSRRTTHRPGDRLTCSYGGGGGLRRPARARPRRRAARRRERLRVAGGRARLRLRSTEATACRNRRLSTHGASAHRASASTSAAPSPISCWSTSSARRHLHRQAPDHAGRSRASPSSRASRACSPRPGRRIDALRQRRARHDARHQHGDRAQGRQGRPGHHRRASATRSRWAARSATTSTICSSRGRSRWCRAPAPRGRRAASMPTARCCRRSTRTRCARRRGAWSARACEAVAVCFLHAYRNAAHEQARASDPGRRSSRQCRSRSPREVAPEIREYERANTACANAYVQPLDADATSSGWSRARGDRGFAGRSTSCCPAAASTTVRAARRVPDAADRVRSGGRRDRGGLLQPRSPASTT